jgi:arylsulfatase A-like enzyme
MLDTVRADKLSCYGYPLPASPALDRLASAGVRFERVIAQCSWTRPSVGSMLTSRHPRTLGLYRERDEILPDGFDTLAGILRANGYRTFGITANPNLNTVFNFHADFDEYTDSSVVFSWMNSGGGQPVRKHQPLPTAPGMFTRILEYARKNAGGQHYVQVNAMEVHEWHFNPQLIRSAYRGAFGDAGERHPNYLRAVRQLTDDTGAFVEALTEIPGWEDTLFVFVSDHGEGLDDHEPVPNGRLHGDLLYESHLVVPWILYRKGWTPPVPVIRQPVRLLELTPTLLDALGMEPAAGMEGRSCWPLIEGQMARVDLPEIFVAETSWRKSDKAAAYAADWNLFLNRDNQPHLPGRELQRAGTVERGALTNRAREHKEVLRRLATHLDRWSAVHPKAPPTPQKRSFSEEEEAQLEAIGYLG